MVRRSIMCCLSVFIILCASGVHISAKENEEKEQIVCEEPNGSDGYYTKKPRIYIYHLGEGAYTKIRFSRPDGEAVEKTLYIGEENTEISPDMFQEGEHYLEVWQENEEEEEIPETRVEKKFCIDTAVPKPVQFIYEKQTEQGTLQFKNKTYLTLEASDEGSGISEIYYQLGKEGGTGNTGNGGRIEIPENFSGSVRAWAADRAGNKGKISESKYIITDVEKPIIQLEADGGFGGWHSKDVRVKISVSDKPHSSGIAEIKCYMNGKLKCEIKENSLFINKKSIEVTAEEITELVVEATDYAGNHASLKKTLWIDKEPPVIKLTGTYDKMITNNAVEVFCTAEDGVGIKDAKMSVHWENASGETGVLENIAWDKKEKSWSLKAELEEEARYSIVVQATDMAGNKSKQEQRVTVDMEKPVISHVAELHGKYLKEFRLGYQAKDIIKDFTLSTYEIRMDGKLRTLPITEKKEGKHSFSVMASDMAGNKSETRVEFIIDHTKPEVIFEGIREGEQYEDNAEVFISTKEKNDIVKEIWINGEKQEIENRFYFDVPGDYEILVKAVDLAKNEEEAKVRFRIVSKRNSIQKVFPELGIKAGKGEERRAGKGKDDRGILCIAGAVVLSLGLGVIVYRKIKRRGGMIHAAAELKNLMSRQKGEQL